MNFLVIIICIVAIVIAIIFKINNISLIYPAILMIVGVILDIIVNIITENKRKKEYTNLDEIKNKIRKKS